MTLYIDTALPNLIDPDGRFGGIIAPIVDDMGFRLIRVAFGGSDPKRGAILQIMIEPKDGTKLGVDACKTVSQNVSAEMDVADPITDNYVLEVGSAGLDRPLTDTRDFTRFVGWEAKIECKRADETGQRRFRGFIEKTTDQGFDLKTQEKGIVSIEWQDLSNARLVASDDLLKALQNGTV
ncbi:MAG: ribosome maturation factor RimP [Alphaproteobacteria bacterium]|nr:MAG: ribosome maturation factor RimP [Alphaproteobacteria bacterium]